MASGEVLRHSVTIDEQEVFCLIHKPVELTEIQPSHFVGRVASWAEYAERRYGDSINPVMTYVENGPHRVSWIHHEGEDWQSGERFCTYHVICDCIAGVEGNSPQGSVDHILGCGAVLHALQRRAAFVDHTYRTGEILAALRDPEVGDFEQSNTFHKFAVKTIGSILELDAKHPKEWPGNVITGEHRVSVLSTLFQLHPEVVKWYGRLLEESGVIADFDGEILRLSPETLAASGFLARRLRSMLYLVVEHFADGDPEPVYRRFSDRGRLAPPGLEYLGSWVTSDLTRCYQVMECADRSLLDEWMASWADLVRFEVHEVVTSAEAAAHVTGVATRPEG